MRIVSVISLVLPLALFAQQRLPPQQHTHWYGGWWPVIKTTTTVPKQPWKEGDAIYERNKSGVSHKSSAAEKARRKADNAEREMRQRERDARIDRNVLEQRLTVSANRAQIESDRRTAAQERRIAADRRNGEIRARAAEQAANLARIQSEQAAKYERQMASLQTCQALNADGSPCRRKANPGLRYCYLHVDYDKGKVKVEGLGLEKVEVEGLGLEKVKVEGLGLEKVKVEGLAEEKVKVDPQPATLNPQLVYEERVNWPLTILAGALAIVCLLAILALIVIALKLIARLGRNV